MLQNFIEFKVLFFWIIHFIIHFIGFFFYKLSTNDLIPFYNMIRVSPQRKRHELVLFAACKMRMVCVVASYTHSAVLTCMRTPFESPLMSLMNSLMQYLTPRPSK